jgi:small conductance mechanosensitive channel
MEDVNVYADKALDYIIEHGPQVLLALITLFLGLWIIRLILKGVRKGFVKSKMDETLRPFIVSLISWTLKALLIISVASMIGIETTSFIAVLGAAGLAIGLALQGTLANFAGGILILIFKPYKKGDFIEAQGEIGVVKEIQIFVTTILTPDNKLVIIPNGAISNGNITNYTAAGKRRVDVVIGISYDSDIKRAKEVLLNVLQSDKKVLKDPEPAVTVLELADSSVNLAVRPWCTPEDYWDVFFGSTEKGKIALDQAGISIPFPQRDVHLIKQG